MIQSYPWYIADWRESETRIRLSLAERALYRELIDYCYLEGSIPTDHVQLSRIAGCTVAEIKKHWATISKLFYEDGERLRHAKVDEVRNKLEAYHEQKKHAGAASGRTRRERSLNGRSNETRTQDEPSPSPAPAPSPAPTPIRRGDGAAVLEYPKALGAVRRYFASADGSLVMALVNLSRQAHSGVQNPKTPPPTDDDIADAIHAAWKESGGKQRSAGLFSTTVPRIIAAWAREPPVKPGPKTVDRSLLVPYDPLGVRKHLDESADPTRR